MTKVLKTCPDCGELFLTMFDNTCENCQEPVMWTHEWGSDKNE